MLAWFLPMVQDATGIIKIPDLKGVVLPLQKPVFSLDSFVTGRFAEQCEGYYNEKSGLRKWLIRLRNQVHYSALKQNELDNLVIGKENYLYGERFIHSAKGKIFRGIDSINYYTRLTSLVRDTLAARGITMVFVIAPGKGFYYPEYIPEKYKVYRTQTNYSGYLEAFKKYELNVLDFNGYFMSQKNKSPYVLFTKLGIHWSNYGSVVCADSFLKAVNKLLPEPVTTFSMEKLEATHQSREMDDADLYESMNLLWKIDDRDATYAYPKLRFHYTTYKPNALFIGDSFYWNWFTMKIPFEVFDPCSGFMYYGDELFPTDPSASVPVTSLNLKEEIEKRKLIVFLFSETNFQRFPFGFIQKACQLYNIK